MRLLHTSDWHLGARLGRHDRHADQFEAIKGLLATARETTPELIVHSGDLFDSPRPPYRSLELGVKALRALAEVAPVVVLSGNHDSPHLLAILDEFAAMGGASRLRIVTRPQVLGVDGLDDLAIAAVPFVPPGAVTDLAPADLARVEGSYADQIRSLNDQLLTQATERAGGGIVLYTAHLHVHGARPGRSERRITVGEDYATHLEGLHRAHYSAFGHIHDPQLLPGGTTTGRYAGSLIPIDFGETDQTKHSVVVDIDSRGVHLATYDLPAGRKLVAFTGSVEEFEAKAADGAFEGCLLKARVLSDDPVTELAEMLARLSPECSLFDLVNVVANRPVKPVSGEVEGEEPDAAALFAEWRASAAGSSGASAPAEATVAAFAGACEQPEALPVRVGAADVVAAATGALEALSTLPRTGA